MTHKDKIRKLAGSVLDAHGTIKIVEKGLLNENTDTAIQAVGALSLIADTLQTAMRDLEQFAMDIGKGGVS